MGPHSPPGSLQRCPSGTVRQERKTETCCSGIRNTEAIARQQPPPTTYIFPRGPTFCCTRLCVESGSVFHIFPSLALEVSVSNQINSPRTSVNAAQITVMYPCTFSQPLVMGITIAGIEIRKVKKTRTAFATIANNHVSYSHS